MTQRTMFADSIKPYMVPNWYSSNDNDATVGKGKFSEIIYNGEAINYALTSMEKRYSKMVCVNALRNFMKTGNVAYLASKPCDYRVEEFAGKNPRDLLVDYRVFYSVIFLATFNSAFYRDGKKAPYSNDKNTEKSTGLIIDGSSIDFTYNFRNDFNNQWLLDNFRNGLDTLEYCLFNGLNDKKLIEDMDVALRVACEVAGSTISSQREIDEKMTVSNGISKKGRVISR